MTLYNHEEVERALITELLNDYKRDLVYGEKDVCTPSEGPIKKFEEHKTLNVRKKCKVQQKQHLNLEELCLSEHPALRFPFDYAQEFGLDTLEEFCHLQEFLFNNGKYQLVPVKKNGDCLFAAFRKGLKCPKGFTNTHLRRHLIMELVKNKEFFYNYLKDPIRNGYSIYDPEDSEKPGPFSFQSYLQYMLKKGSWGDAPMIAVMSMLFGVSITVVDAVSLSETKFRHNHPLKTVDMVLVFCGGNHYVAAVKPKKLAVDPPQQFNYSYAAEEASVYSDEEDCEYKEVVKVAKEKAFLLSSWASQFDEARERLKTFYHLDPCRVLSKTPCEDKAVSATCTDFMDSSLTGNEDSVICEGGVPVKKEDSSDITSELGSVATHDYTKVDDHVSVDDIEEITCSLDNFTVSEVGGNASGNYTLSQLTDQNTKVTKHYCEDCKKYFSQKHTLDNHRKTQHFEGFVVMCTICGKTFPSTGKLNEHLESHFSLEQKMQSGLQCPYCFKLYTAKRNCKTHMKGCKAKPLAM